MTNAKEHSRNITAAMDRVQGEGQRLFLGEYTHISLSNSVVIVVQSGSDERAG